MDAAPIKRSSLQLEVVNRLRAEIVEGHWRPGVRLQERLLCERFGISRSPLREAYQVLASEGLIEASHNKGAVVTAPTPSATLQQFELLRALELLAVRLACRNATTVELEEITAAEASMQQAAANGDLRAFFRANNNIHRLIVLASGNGPLADAHIVTARQIIRVQNLEGPLEHIASEGVGEHDDVITALAARDEARAVALFSAHLDTVEDNLRGRLRAFAREAA